MKHYVIGVLALVLTAGAAWAQTMYRWADKDGSVHYSDQPPPADVKNVQERQLRTPNSIETSGMSYSTRKAQQDFPVTLYSGADCEYECKLARDFLSRRGIPFAEVRLESPEQAAAFKQLFGGKEVYVPAVTVGSQKQVGFNEATWAGLLDNVGYPRTAVPRSAAAAKPAEPSAPAAPDSASTPEPAGTPPQDQAAPPESAAGAPGNDANQPPAPTYGTAGNPPTSGAQPAPAAR